MSEALDGLVQFYEFARVDLDCRDSRMRARLWGVTS